MNATELTNLKSMLLRHEGVRLKPYFDSVNKLTIGVGRNLDDFGISQDEAMYLLESDIRRVESDLNRALPLWTMLSGPRQIVLANMCFNMGINRLLGFIKFLAYMQAGRFDEAATEMLDSKWAKQVGSRATELAQMMRLDSV